MTRAVTASDRYAPMGQQVVLPPSRPPSLLPPLASSRLRQRQNPRRFHLTFPRVLRTHVGAYADVIRPGDILDAVDAHPTRGISPAGMSVRLCAPVRDEK